MPPDRDDGEARHGTAGRPRGAAGSLGQLLHDRRQAAGLTQRQLAVLAGIGVGTVRDLEQGRTRRPSPRSVHRLAGALGLDAEAAGQLARATAARATGVQVAGAPAVGGSGLWVQVLGPLAVWRDGVPVAVSAPKYQVVLGVLAVEANAPVHRDAIINAAWPDDPPATATSLMQSYVARLGRILEPGRPARDHGRLLVSAGACYRLQVSEEQLDLLAFQRLVGLARQAASSGAPAGACDLYDQALGLWQGEPLTDVGALRHHPSVVGLGRERIAAVSGYADTAFGAGLHERVLPHLRTLAGQHQLDERAHARLMIALAGTGQQAEALRVYEDLRRRLDDELGLRPGEDLAEAHLRVLRQEVLAASPAARPAHSSHHRGPGRTAPVVPRQLPAAARQFTGRPAELRALTRLLDEVARPAVVIAAISGTAGVGKTALALHWAHQVSARFPDGQLYINLRGFDPAGPPVPPAAAIRRFLDALAAPAERIPADPDAQAGLYRSLLAGRRMIIVLDNARDAAQVRPLLPGAPGCLTVVTSRDQLTSLVAVQGAVPLTLDVLTWAEARDLLARRAGAGRVEGDPAAAAELVGLCARLPLALSIAAARAVVRPGLPLRTLAAELRASLDALDSGDPAASIQAAFSWSYRNLSTPAARMFRLLGMHPGPDISGPAAASMAGIPLARARRALDELTRSHLVTEPALGRFTFHDLLRSYAAGLARARDSDGSLRRAARRVLDHYLHTGYAATLLLNPARPPLALEPPGTGSAPESLASDGQALGWLEAEHEILLSVVTWAADAGFDRHAWQIAWTLGDFLDFRGRWHEWAAIQHTALVSARRVGDREGQACTHHTLGRTYSLLGSYRDAQTHLEQCLELARQLGDLACQARGRLGLGRLFEYQGNYATACAQAQQALSIFRNLGLQGGQADALMTVGWCLAHLGDSPRALACGEQAIALHREAGDRRREGVTWVSLGYARHNLGHYQLAVFCYRQAIDLLSQLGDRYNEAQALAHLADSQHAAGDLAGARNAWQQALGILDDLGHPDADRLRARLTGPA